MNEETYDEISLRELIEALLKRKKLIALITLGCLLAGALYSFVLAEPVYESQARISISIPESVDTPYGLYTFPSREAGSYMELVGGPRAIAMTSGELGEGYGNTRLSRMIRVEKEQDTGDFRMVVSAPDPEEAWKVASVHLDSYIASVELVLKRSAVDTFLAQKTRDEERLSRQVADATRELAGARKVLAEIPLTIETHKALIADGESAWLYGAETGRSAASLRGETILSQEVNPAFGEMSLLVGQLELNLNQLESQLEAARRDKEELMKEHTGLDGFQATPETIDALAPGLDLRASILSVLHFPDLQENRAGPNRTLNLAISLVLGLMIGVFAAFFLEYWEKSRPEACKPS